MIMELGNKWMRGVAALMLILCAGNAVAARRITFGGRRLAQFRVGGVPPLPEPNLSTPFVAPTFSSSGKPICGVPNTPCCRGKCEEGGTCVEEGSIKICLPCGFASLSCCQGKCFDDSKCIQSNGTGRCQKNNPVPSVAPQQNGLPGFDQLQSNPQCGIPNGPCCNGKCESEPCQDGICPGWQAVQFTTVQSQISLSSSSTVRIG